MLMHRFLRLLHLNDGGGCDKRVGVLCVILSMFGLDDDAAFADKVDGAPIQAWSFIKESI